ncbi:L-alanine-DL-glutamate epimerase [Hyunsoonleella jejuensis]|uniref:Dipeptide epimerase n=2 Tax=Hyunsoonleella jejuensis TaxID=419940 RepID=A0A1H9DPY1_9FLAO|nr:L-alanine-DL-glutamate epimerase [Hyunsoonleella jejuensis]
MLSICIEKQWNYSNIESVFEMLKFTNTQILSVFHNFRMKIKLTTTHCKLQLEYPFSISRYTVSTQDTIIVCISNGAISGYGEATVNPYYGSTIEGLETSVKSVFGIVEASSGLHPKDLWKQLEPILRNDYFALCAIDCAYWDFYARLQRSTLRSFWSTNELKLPQTNYTIGIDEISVMQSKIKENPWPIYKIKLGVEHDLEIVKALRSVTDSVFRIDANCAWETEETIKKSEVLKGLGVEFIEQPLKANDWEGMTYVKKKCKLPIIADESCQKLEDVQKCAKAFHGVNIKLMKCGGITPALQMIENARKYQLKTMIGCMTESSVGISNIAQLAPLLDYLDADGSLLLKNDIAEGVRFKSGNILYPDDYGSGVRMKN